MTVHRSRAEVALAAEIRSNPQQTFGRIFELHGTTIYNYCFRQTASWDAAEDLTSTVFLEAWRCRNRLVIKDGSILPWLYGIATNVCRRERRGSFRQWRALRRLPSMVDQPDPADEVASRVDDERRMAEVLTELGRLPTRQRDVVVLVAWEELDYEAAAIALGIPVGTVRSRLSRARRRLSDSLASAHIQEQE
ncbi:MAG: RNA polymerase sigma factor [bacterium]